MIIFVLIFQLRVFKFRLETLDVSLLRNELAGNLMFGMRQFLLSVFRQLLAFDIACKLPKISCRQNSFLMRKMKFKYTGIRLIDSLVIALTSLCACCSALRRNSRSC